MVGRPCHIIGSSFAEPGAAVVVAAAVAVVIATVAALLVLEVRHAPRGLVAAGAGGGLVLAGDDVAMGGGGRFALGVAQLGLAAGQLLLGGVERLRDLVEAR